MSSIIKTGVKTKPKHNWTHDQLMDQIRDSVAHIRHHHTRYKAKGEDIDLRNIQSRIQEALNQFIRFNQAIKAERKHVQKPDWSTLDNILGIDK